MSKKVFDVGYLRSKGLPDEGFIKCELVDYTRWSLIFEIIFEDDNKYWKTTYSTGATEEQYEGPWEYEEKVMAVEVEFRVVTKTEWVAVE